MSGGHFEYNQYKIGYIADEIETLIENNDSDEKNGYGDTVGHHFRLETIEEFKKALKALRVAQVYAHRIDWLVSGDDGEDSFHRRLKNDLGALGETK
jgi:hypothetical protein